MEGASTEPKARRIAFAYSDEVSAFDKSVTEYLRAALDEKNKAFMPAENCYRYKHGIAWRNHHSSDPDEISDLQAHSTEMQIPFADIVANNIHSMHNTLTRLVDEMHATFMKSLFETVNDAVERVGNVVDAKSKPSQAEAFLEMLRKIEFGVDRDGNPTLPSIHAAPKTAEALMAALSKQGPEFEAEVERIKSEKIAAALAREAERRSKFFKYEA